MESEIAAQPATPGGQLLLTDWSRSCASLWRSVFGARFACRAPRKDVGRRFPSKLVGTSEAVRVQHGHALKRLCSAAKADETDAPAKSRRLTIFGFRRRGIEESTKEPLPPGKSLLDFRKRTAELTKTKQAHAIWNGCTDAITLRRKAKPATTPRQRLARARQWWATRRSDSDQPGRLKKARPSKNAPPVIAPSQGPQKTPSRHVQASSPSLRRACTVSKMNESAAAKSLSSSSSSSPSLPSRKATTSLKATGIRAASAPSRGGAKMTRAPTARDHAQKASIRPSLPSTTILRRPGVPAILLQYKQKIRARAARRAAPKGMSDTPQRWQQSV